MSTVIVEGLKSSALGAGMTKALLFAATPGGAGMILGGVIGAAYAIHVKNKKKIKAVEKENSQYLDYIDFLEKELINSRLSGEEQ
jgi:hypothetical protein